MKKMMCLLLCLCLFPASFAFAESGETGLRDVISQLMTGSDLAQLYDRMTDDMRAAVSQDALGALWGQLTATGGDFIDYDGDTQVAEQNGYRVMTQTLHMSQLDLLCTLVLDGDDHIAGLSFSPVAQESVTDGVAANVTEEEVTVGEAPWALSGTLTMPASDAPVPAVVLVHGSGPNDRDETVGGTKLFRDLAESLSARGIAVLRYEKRTKTYGQEIAASEEYAAFSVEEETIQDAINAGKLLASDSRIDPERVFVLGHSLGAMLAPRIVKESGGVFCGMILACGTNLPLTDIMLRQNEDAVAAVADEATRAAYEAQLDEIRAQLTELSGMTAEEAKQATVFGVSGYYFWEMAQQASPAEIMTELALPTLLINGARDFQVTQAEGAETWEAVLDMNAPWLQTLWPDVNHLLMKPDADAAIAGTTGEYQLACVIDKDVADTIAAFILKTEDTNQ